jgi:nitrite reductase (NO-forming)
MKLNKNNFQLIILTVLLLTAPTIFSAPPDVGFVIKDPTVIPPPITRHQTQHVVINLEAKEVLAEINSTGAKAWVWTFNGTVPGPMIRVMEGDTVTINLLNNSENTAAHSIDLHAVIGPGGGAVVTEGLPGETKSVTFKATNQGAYIYHCAAEGLPWKHIGYGMFGMIVVVPKGGLPNVDKEFYIGQSEWYHNNLGDPITSAIGLPSGTLMLDEGQAETEIPNSWSFNGHEEALKDSLTTEMHANQGDTVRFFLVNGGPNKGANWHIIGTIFDKTYQGHFSDVLRNQETEYVAPGAAAVFELETKVPGTYLLVDHALFRVKNGALGFLHVDPVGAWPDDIYSPEPGS